MTTDSESYSACDFVRKGTNSYPIFSLRKEESALCDEMRGIFKSQSVSWIEHELPGTDGPEIGFVVPLSAWCKITMLEDGQVSDDLSQHIHVWTSRPTLTALPEGISLPKESRVDPIVSIKRFLAPPDDYSGGWGPKPEEENFTIMNVQTGETAEIYANRKTQSYTISKDISSWEIVTPI